MTNQEAYNKVKIHLLNQKKKALRPGFVNACQYKTADGLKCAIGALLPDSMLTREFIDENTTIDKLLDTNDEVSEIFSGVEPGLLRMLQEAHDHYDPDHWLTALGNVAKAWRLQP